MWAQIQTKRSSSKDLGSKEVKELVAMLAVSEMSGRFRTQFSTMQTSILNNIAR